MCARQVEVDKLVAGSAFPLAQQRLQRHEFFRDCLAISQVQVKVRRLYGRVVLRGRLFGWGGASVYSSVNGLPIHSSRVKSN